MFLGKWSDLPTIDFHHEACTELIEFMRPLRLAMRRESYDTERTKKGTSINNINTIKRVGQLFLMFSFASFRFFLLFAVSEPSARTEFRADSGSHNKRSAAPHSRPRMSRSFERPVSVWSLT